jgi:cupin fold WbuC family metalloprotein
MVVDKKTFFNLNDNLNLNDDFGQELEMVIDNEILDGLTAKAKENPRLRCNLDMRNSADDQSQRMLNALEPGTAMPIHRHKGSSETCICIRGHFEEYFYDENGNLTDTIDMVPGGVVLNIEKGQWHSLKCLESGTVLFEAKDGKYEPLGPEDILSL